MTYKEFSVKTDFNQESAPDAMTATGFSDESNPFIPSKNQTYVFRQEFLREVLGFLKEPGGDALYITGPTGSGKTSGICEVAARLNWPVQQLTAHGRLELSDLIGHHALQSPKPGETPVMNFMFGPLAIAMSHGHLLLINEVDLADPAELAGLNDVLEGRPLVIAENGGQIIKPHPMFRVVVTGNSVGSGDTTGLYQGVMMQNLAAMDRYRFTKVDYADQDVEFEILERIAPRLPANVRTGMIRVANEVRKLFTGEDSEGGKISVTLSTRTLVRWAKISMLYRGAPNALEYALQQSLLTRTNATDREALLRIAKDIFGDNW